MGCLTEPVMPIKADACSRGTPGRVEHRARNASGLREDMPHCRPDDVRGGFVLCRCVEHRRPTWRAELIVDIVKRPYSRLLSCRPHLLFTLALCYTLDSTLPPRYRVRLWRTRRLEEAGYIISAPNGQGENEKSESRFRRSSFNAFASGCSCAEPLAP